jgi:hypothetical protein
MNQRRLMVVKWLNTTPVLGVRTLCSRQSKVPMSALRTTGDAHANLQGHFDGHECDSEDTRQSAVLLPANLSPRREPEEEEEEDDDKDKKDDDADDGTDDGYSE